MGVNLTNRDRAADFADLYEDTYLDVTRFVGRRTSPDAVEDIVHETFLVAWRRFDDLPRDRGAGRAWLFATARNCLLSSYRGDTRRIALSVRLTSEIRTAEHQTDETVALRLDLAAAWQRLQPREQEILSLSILEDLPSTQAGIVLGISSAAYRIRLHRARASLRRLLDPTTFPVLSTDQLVTE
jgi:RNA polymerase sigma-70 factor (ECF subfamily)